MEDKHKLIKSHIAKLIRRHQYVVGHAPENPVDWQLDEVIDPRSGEPFTYPGAWDFIAEKLEQKGTTIEEKTLDQPPKKKGFITLSELENILSLACLMSYAFRDRPDFYDGIKTSLEDYLLELASNSH